MENHILLIDDDEDETVLLEMMLKQCTKPVKIHQAMRLEQAITFADSPVPTPRLIFLDLRLPEMSGLDILAWIRAHKRLKEVPVVIWSHTANEDDIEQSRQQGGNYFVSKTADASTTHESVRYICENWLL